MAQIPVKSVSSQQESQPSSATTSSFMNHSDIVQIRERFNHEISKMQRQVAAMIQEMFEFLAEEFEQVTIKIFAAQEQHSSDRSFADITQSTVNVGQLNYGYAAEQQTSTTGFESDHEQRIESSTSFDNSTESVISVKTSNHFSAAMLEPKEEPNECSVEEVPLSISQYIRTTFSKEVVEINRETEIGDRDNEMIEDEGNIEIDENHGIEIDDEQDREIDEANEMDSKKLRYGIKTISLRCNIGGCEYMADEKLIICHKRETHGVLRYHCLICDPIISFDCKQYLGDHIKLKHLRETDFRCDLCSRTFNTYSTYKTHKYKYHDTGVFRCIAPDCAFEHTIRRQVYRHIRQGHKQYVCTAAGCGQSFGDLFNLRQHERVHLQVRPYSCAYSDHCNYASTRRESVKQHIRAVHFRLPPSQKKQSELNIIDERDASEYLRVDEDLLRRFHTRSPSNLAIDLLVNRIKKKLPSGTKY